MFRVIPAVDLKDGKCVQLQQGKADRVLVELEDPVEVAVGWVEEGAKALHVIDLSGAFEGRLFHEDVIFRIKEETGVEMQVGGGIRSVEIAERLLDRGINRVILGTLAFRDVEGVKALARDYPGRVMVAIDSRGGKVVVEGWRKETNVSPAELARVYGDCEVSLLYTNVDVEGLMKGVKLGSIREVVETGKPVYVAGGISSVEDVRAIKEIGAAGVVLGSAIYSGKLKLKDVLGFEEF